MTQPRFAIGTQYRTRGQYSRLCTVTDIHRTFDSKGELVRIRYVSTHELCGQIVTERDVVDATIAMGLLPKPAVVS